MNVSAGGFTSFRPLTSFLLAAILLTLSRRTGVGATEASSKVSPPIGGETAGKTTAFGAGKTNGPGLLIDGEHFTTRQIIDQQQGGLPVCVFVAPEKWRDRSQVVWNYAHHSSPVKLSASVENPTNAEAFFSFPTLEFFSVRPDGGYYRPGQEVGGLINAPRQPPVPTLLYFVKQARAGFANLQVIGSKDLPELPQALRLAPSPNQRGIGIKVTYEANGKPVEEEFYGVYYSIDIPYDGPQGRSWQNNWGLTALHSFRAPSGDLNRRRPVFAAIAKSFRPNPAWQQRLGAVNAFLADQFNRQLQAGYDSIAAAANLSRQISANNDAMIASIDRQLQASRVAHPAASAGRSPSDKFDDYVRGVETVDDPYYGTSQHSSNEQYHWTDGYGTYRNSNDPTFNPNQHENGDWQLMTPSR